MSDQTPSDGTKVNTVLGRVPAEELGIIATHETLLSVYPGAHHAPDVSIDRAEIFETLAEKLKTFRDHGGGTIVDAAGMYHGRDVSLYEALSQATGVHIVASTGMGPERMLGGYFLTPQTNPPTPWPAEKFETLFTAEVIEGMVVPRVERRGPAGLVTALADRNGMTPTEEGLFRGAARTAKETGVAMSVRFGQSAMDDLDVVLSEGLPADRILVGDLDRIDAVEADAAKQVAEKGAYIGIDHVGLNDSENFIDDDRRAKLLTELIEAGYGKQLILSSSAVGVAKGHPGYDLPYSHVVTTFIPFAKSRGLSDDDATLILQHNPRNLLTGGSAR